MNVAEVVAALRLEARTVVWEGEKLEALPYVTRRSTALGEGSCVTAYSLDSAHINEAISGEIAYFGALRRPFEWKVFSFDSPANLLDRLRASGFSVGEQETVVVYDLADGLGPFEGEYPCEVRRIERTEELADFRFVAEPVFAKDYGHTTTQLAKAIQSGERGHDGYIGYVGGEPASIGRLYTNPASSFAGLYGGGTRAEFRGRGCYRAVVAARARDAALAGSRYLLVDALPTSLPILRRLGFVRVADTWPCTSPR